MSEDLKVVSIDDVGTAWLLIFPLVVGRDYALTRFNDEEYRIASNPDDDIAVFATEMIHNMIIGGYMGEKNGLVKTTELGKAVIEDFQRHSAYEIVEYVSPRPPNQMLN
jgi:hypothetical protein